MAREGSAWHFSRHLFLEQHLLRERRKALPAAAAPVRPPRDLETERLPSVTAVKHDATSSYEKHRHGKHGPIAQRRN